MNVTTRLVSVSRPLSAELEVPRNLCHENIQKNKKN
jgi:hypothetical protein